MAANKNNELQKTFKITDLPSINKIDNDDLLIVSDHEDNSLYKWTTKSMSMQKLVSFISSVILQNPQLLSQIQLIASDVATNIASTVVEDIATNKVMNIVKENRNEIFDLIDDEKDNTMYINAGGAI